MRSKPLPTIVILGALALLLVVVAHRANQESAEPARAPTAGVAATAAPSTDEPPLANGPQQPLALPQALGNFIEFKVTAAGRTYVGWVRDLARVEAWDADERRYQRLADTAENRDRPGALIRLYHVAGFQGFMVLDYTHITSLEKVRTISIQEEEELKAALAEERKR